MTFLVVDNRLLDHPDTGMHGILLETLERHYYTTASVFCIPVGQEVLAPASGVHADALMDRIAHDIMWVETCSHNMRERATMNQ